MTVITVSCGGGIGVSQNKDQIVRDKEEAGASSSTTTTSDDKKTKEKGEDKYYYYYRYSCHDIISLRL